EDRVNQIRAQPARAVLEGEAFELLPLPEVKGPAFAGPDPQILARVEAERGDRARPRADLLQAQLVVETKEAAFVARGFGPEPDRTLRVGAQARDEVLARAGGQFSDPAVVEHEQTAPARAEDE